MFPGIIRQIRALVTATAVLTGAAIPAGSTAAADSQDDKFFELLGQKDVPAIDNATSLIAVGHKVCSKLDGGMSVNDLVELIRNNGFNENPLARLYPQDRVTSTIDRFITAAVQAYCPSDQGKIASIAAYHPPVLSHDGHRVAAHTNYAIFSGGCRQALSGCDVIRMSLVTDDRVMMQRPNWRNRSHDVVLTSMVGAIPAGEIPPTKPLPVPAKAPPAPEELTPAPQQPLPPRRVQQPPQRQQMEPPPEEPPPQEPPLQAAPSAAPPGPGGDAGGAPAPESPSPGPPAPPGHIRLAP